MIIRKMELADKANLFGLVCEFPAQTVPVESKYSAIFDELLEDVNSFVAVAEIDDRLIGYIAGYRHSAFYASGKTAWVDELLVSETNRNSGVGRLLMACFENWADEGGCKLVSLATAGAKSFYENIGYSSKADYFKRYLC